jgi:hypothetical protein
MNSAAFMKPLAMGILAAVALASGTPLAHAIGTDDFLRQVRTNGFGLHKSDAALIQDAQEVCAMLDYQESAFQYLDQHSGLDDRQSAMFVTVSVKYFCPQLTPG